MASTNSKNKTVAGDVRPSQVIWSYGPGALIDLQNISVVALGLEGWDKLPYWSQRPETIDEPRLLGQVRRELGRQVDELRVPPVAREVFGTTQADSEGMPVSPFPRWYRCRHCKTLGTIDQGSSFRLEGTNSDRLRVVHLSCPDGHKNQRAVPARFLVTCANGHLSDFPWREFAHGGPTTCRQPLEFFEVGASMQTENLFVKCKCEQQKPRSMAEAFRPGALSKLRCPGRHPHLGQQATCSECDAELKPILLGATNMWFSKVLSVLSLPTVKSAPQQPADKVTQAVVTSAEDLLDDKDDFTDLEAFEKIVRKKNRYELLRPEIAEMPIEDIWEIVQTFYGPCNGDVTAFEEQRRKEETKVQENTNIKLPEWRALTSKDLPFRELTFEAEETDCPDAFAGLFKRIVLVRRLREVRALVGFTRLEAEDSMIDAPEHSPTVVPLTTGKPTWVPSVEVRGEGIFIQFDEEALVQWENRPSVREREGKLLAAYAAWRKARNRSPEGFPGIRYVLLHTFAHAMIRELSLACGYSAASIRERIYASSASESEPMAGVLLYTASSDSDGTLGGLVDLGKADNLEPLLTEGIKAMQICSSDPLCSDYDPTAADSATLDMRLAACHACSYVSETSCENGNLFLDRAILTETLVGPDCAFFP